MSEYCAEMSDRAKMSGEWAILAKRSSENKNHCDIKNHM